jgi:hypothetical protein
MTQHRHYARATERGSLQGGAFVWSLGDLGQQPQQRHKLQQPREYEKVCRLRLLLHGASDSVAEVTVR